MAVQDYINLAVGLISGIAGAMTTYGAMRGQIIKAKADLQESTVSTRNAEVTYLTTLLKGQDEALKTAMSRINQLQEHVRGIQTNADQLYLRMEEQKQRYDADYRNLENKYIEAIKESETLKGKIALMAENMKQGLEERREMQRTIAAQQTIIEENKHVFVQHAAKLESQQHELHQAKTHIDQLEQQLQQLDRRKAAAHE